ncbi:MAG: hypothetical protein ACRD4X_15000, partial [Candidatus Acidiferrales bacterium]
VVTGDGFSLRAFANIFAQVRDQGSNPAFRQTTRGAEGVAKLLAGQETLRGALDETQSWGVFTEPSAFGSMHENAARPAHLAKVAAAEAGGARILSEYMICRASGLAERVSEERLYVTSAEAQAKTNRALGNPVQGGPGT